MRAPRALRLLVKACLTVGIFWVLFNHPIDNGDGTRTPLWTVLSGRLGQLTWDNAGPYLAAAIAIKTAGIVCAMLRWHLLLVGQGIRFNFGHVAGSFLIGRFLGTFLPGTIGLDGYKLYDASRFSGRVAEPAAATVVEKIYGLLGIIATFVLTLPFGYRVLGPGAASTAALTLPLALVLAGCGVAAVTNPAWIALLFRRARPDGRVGRAAARVVDALRAYAGQRRRLVTAVVLSFMVHFCTAAMYYFTALAVGASGASFFEVVFASSIQIFATVISPFTIAGEGVREVVQALLLAKRIGLSESIISAALGFWAAEALTLVGAIFWWQRSESYRPRKLALE